MVTEANSNKIAFTDLLQKQHPEIAEAIVKKCTQRGIEVIIIKGANDLWCRDFMPVQIAANKFVQFVYDPSYYHHKDYRHLQTDINKLNYAPAGEIIESDIILDGGNISHFNKTALVSDRIFKDNPRYNKGEIIKQLTDLLQLNKLVIIPSVPYDITGHSDGMVKFINEDTIFLNDFSSVCSTTYWRKLTKALQGFNIVLMPNEFQRNKLNDDATRDYINMIVIQDLICLWVFNRQCSLSTGSIRISRAHYHTHPFLSLTVDALPWEWPMYGEADIWSFCISPEKLLLIGDRYNPGIWFYTTEAIPYYKLNLFECIEDVYTWGTQTYP